MPNVLNFMCLFHHTKNRRSSHKSASKTQDSCQEPGGTLKHFDVLSSSFKADAPLYDLSMFTLSLAMRKMQTWKWKYVWGQSVGFLQSHRFCWDNPEVSGLYSISLIGLSQVDIHGNTSKNLFLSCVLMIALQLLNSLPFLFDTCVPSVNTGIHCLTIYWVLYKHRQLFQGLMKARKKWFFPTLCKA